MEEILLINAALALVERLAPRVEQWIKQREVGVPEQEAEVARYNSLKARSAGQFRGPEWDLPPATPPAPPA